MPPASNTHIVLIPSYNAGSLLEPTVRSALAVWSPVWVVIDGSSDNSLSTLQAMQSQSPGLRVLQLTHNSGKGAAVLHGLELAQAEGFTHALTMDSDGQHPAQLIAQFMQTSQQNPKAMVLGKPVFGPEAPRIRVWGRKISNFWADVETLGAGIGDSLYGFRVYPIAPLVRIMHGQTRMRRFDFDPEAAVRLSWSAVPAINLPAPVRYLDASEGGVTQFKYLRDNSLLTWMHLRLFVGFVLRLPLLITRRWRSGKSL